MGITAEVTIKVKRGTKAELGTLGALLEGELGYVTDEDRVYIGDGANNFLIGRVDFASTGPTGNGVAGTLYVNEATDEIYFSNGAGWAKVGVTDLSELTGDLDDIDDGQNYKRVAISEFATGTNYVNRIYDGTNAVTAAEGRTHIDDATKHRVINDSATGNTDLWSAHKILEYVSNNLDGLDWQNSVLDKDTSSPPTGPSEGDRYIVGPSADGGWSGHDGDIAEYRDGSWVFIDPNEGFCVAVEDENIEYVYSGIEWISRPASTNHNNLSGLDGGTAGQYYHLTSADYTALTTNLNETIQDIVGDMTDGGTETGITVDYNDTTGKLNFALNFGSVEPPSVGPNTGAAGTATDVAHADHSHDLGAHNHSATGGQGGQIPHANLSGIGANDHHNQVHAFHGPDHTMGPWTPSKIMASGTGGDSVDFVDIIDGGSFV